MTTTPSASERRATDSYCIVVGVVPDETGQNALLEAWRMASFHGSAQLHVVRVVESGGPSDVAARALEALPSELRDFVRNVVGQARDERSVVIHTRVGKTAEAIHQLAVDVDADLIVVGTHARTGVSRWTMSSAAETLARIAHCPVLVAHPKDFSGIERTAAPDPLCPDCLAARQGSGGATLWCEAHRNDGFQPHAVGYDEVVRIGRDDGGFVPSRT